MLFGWVATTWMAGAPVRAAGVPQDAEVRGSTESTSAKANPSQPEKMPAKHRFSSVEEEPSFTAQHDWRRWGTDFLQDQKEIWTSPARLQFSDTQWLVPIAGVTAGLMQTDAQYSRHLSNNPSTLRTYNNLSNATVAALLGGAGGMWLLSYRNHDQHWRETGFLAGEAAVNSLVVVEAMKYAAQRDRPNQDLGQGLFFQKGGTSFPSEHAAAAWAVAGVIAHEYPGPVPKLLAYGLASVVSFSRIRARQHFPSDVFIGGIVGDMIGQQIFSRHHDPELGGEFWSSLSHTFRSESAAKPGNQGSPYVPLDSWVYPIFDRLRALGYVNTAVVGQRPWTRLECARLLTEAASAFEGPLQGKLAESPEVRGLLSALQQEFSNDVELLADGGWNTGAHIESVYTRFTEIAGKPLTDSEHFGETLTNDFGRPYQEGLNNVTGFSGWATAGRWVAYVRGEYQAAPAGPAYSAPIRNFIAQADNNPVQPATGIPATSQFQLLDAYVGLNFSNWQLTFGQQSLDWGPSRMGSLNFGDNAAPMRMIQLNRTVPLVLPWIFRYLGPMRVDLFFGNMDGHQFPPSPIFHGEKISFMPLPNLEFGFSRTVVMGGLGRPLTSRSVWNSYTSVTTIANENPTNDPGKRTGGFDVSYRIPLPRYPMTFYVDSLADDNTSPLADPRRAGVNTGLYIPKIPVLNKLDLRMEAAYTDVPFPEQAGKFIYYDGFYHDLYTNKGQLLGNTVGRDGKVYQAWSRYWIGARTHLELGYRHAQVSAKFVPGGGTINDASVSVDLLLHQVWSLNTSVQYEQWQFPILAHGPQQNVSVSIGMSFLPHWGKRQSSPVPISMTHTSASVGEPVQ
jgi:membrane-associated phospholipid phosphatase